MEYLAERNLFTSQFTIGCEISEAKNVEHVQFFHDWCEHKDTGLFMRKYRTDRTQYISFLHLIEIPILEEILTLLVSSYKQDYPYAEKKDFIEHVFRRTIYDLNEIISYDLDSNSYTSLPNANYDVYHHFLERSNLFVDFCIPSDSTIENYQQYYKKVIKLINDIDFEPINDNETEKSLSEDAFLKKEFREINLSLLELDDLEGIIEERISEIEKCLKSNAPLAVLFLCGSTLEGLLSNLASKNIEQFNKAKSAPKYKGEDGKVKQIKDWNLSDFINVAYENNIIGLDVKKHSHSLRDFRNYIHPREQESKKFSPDLPTAKIEWQVLKAVIHRLSEKNN